jgi:putative DNA primase/helicase
MALAERFALGNGLVAGLPDEGKGQVFANMAATVTKGGNWPCNEGEAPKGNVLLLTAEDDVADTVVPRLKAAGADLDRVEIVSMVRDQNGKRMFNLADDLDLLRKKIAEVGDVKLIQIDPISAYLGNQIDSFRTTAVRSVLAPLVDLAAEMNVSIIGMLHFNKKLDVNNALLRISDSLAFGATARHVYAVVDDAEHKRKLFVKAKNNLATSDNKSLAFRFGVRDVGMDDQTGEVITAPYIRWEGEHVEVTASQAMAATKSPGARDQAKKFLADFLADGPVLKIDVEEAADAHAISHRTLVRAKDELSVIVEKEKGVANGKWVWRLPDQAQTGRKSRAPLALVPEAA